MKFFKYILILIIIITAAFYVRISESQVEANYGDTQTDIYLAGKYSPWKHPLFVKPGDMGISVDGKSHYLRKEAADALKKMNNAFRKDNPGIMLTLISSTRTFWDQKTIWENKWDSGAYSSGTKNLLDKALRILKYSSMPGTSRHHWGTDFDINNLTNEYFEKGDGKVIYQWLKTNAHKYGFCQPYTAGRDSGYMEERWHWSYAPLAKIFLRDWNRFFSGGDNSFSRKGLFKGSENSGHLAAVYVNSINDKCK